MLNQFKTNRPYNSFLLFVYGLVLCWSALAKPFVLTAEKGDGFGWRLIMQFLSLKNGQSNFALALFFMVMVFTLALLINRLSILQRLFTRLHYLTGMSFLLLLSVLVSRFAFSSSLFSCVLLLSMLNKTASLQNATNPKTDIFNIALVFGLASTFFAPSIWFLSVLMLSMIFSRPFKLNEWLLMVVGFLTPYYFFYTVSFIAGNKIENFEILFRLHKPSIALSLAESVLYLFLIVLVTVGMYYVQFNMRRLLVQSRKTWSFLTLWMIVGVLIPFLNSDFQFCDFIFLLPPLAAFISAFFCYQPKSWISVVLHWLVIALSIVIGVENLY